MTATVLAWHLLRELKVDLLEAPSQVQRYPTRIEPLLHVLSGDADVALLEAGALELLIARGDVLASDVRVLDEAFEMVNGAPFPFRHSTRTYPRHGMVAMAHVPADVRSAVKSALLALAPQDPAAVALQSAGFTPSQSNMGVVPVLEKMNLLGLSDARMVCQQQSIWTCDENSFFRGTSADLPCATVPCPSGGRCTCRPCRLSDDIAVCCERG